MTVCHHCKKVAVITSVGEQVCYQTKPWTCHACKQSSDYYTEQSEIDAAQRDREEENQRRMRDTSPRPIDRFGG